MNLKVNWKDFDPERLVQTNIEKRTITPKPDPTKSAADQPKPIDEQSIPQMYRYQTFDDKGNVTGEVVSELCVELPKITSPDGIKTEKGKGSSILCHFDQNDKDVKDFCENFCENYLKILFKRLFTHRGHISSISSITDPNHIAGSIKPILFRQRDPNTSELVPGKNPTKYFKLIDFGEPGSFKQRQTPFVEPIIDPVTKKPKIVEWDILRNVRMQIIPLIKFKLYHRSKIQLEATMISAVLVGLEKSGTENRQMDTCLQISQDKLIMESLELQLKNIRLAVKGSDNTSDKNDNSSTTEPPKTVAPLPTPQLPTPSLSTPQLPTPSLPTPVQSNFTKPPSIPGIPMNVPNLANIMANGPTN